MYIYATAMYRSKICLYFVLNCYEVHINTILLNILVYRLIHYTAAVRYDLSHFKVMVIKHNYLTFYFNSLIEENVVKLLLKMTLVWIYSNF